MIVVGERINASRAGIMDLIATRDAGGIVREATAQLEAGADYIDVNAGTLADEPDALCWLIREIQSATGARICIDSSDPRAIAAALPACRDHVLINSISGEAHSHGPLIPLLQEHDASVVLLCLDDSGMPATRDDALRIGGTVIDRLTAAGIDLRRIYVDPLVRSVSLDHTAGRTVLDTITSFKREYGEVATICGLSNISFGLPARRVLNRAFAAAAIAAGLDAAILDPLDEELMALVTAADLVAGNDEHCRRYIAGYRAGRLS